MKELKPKILFILHLPPPVHGASMVGKYIQDSHLINDEFDCHYINLATAKDLNDIGKGGWRKSIAFLKLLMTVYGAVKRLKPRLVYVTPNAAGMPFYKDFMVVSLLKALGCKVICHYHNKGVSTRQNRWLDNWVYKRFFRKLKVILLSKELYPDVQKYVSRKDVCICPNGIPDLSTPIVRKISDKSLNILFLSNMMEEKGVWTLLEACRILKGRKFSFVCRFVGGWKDITEEVFYRRATAYGLSVETPHHPNAHAEIIALGSQYGKGKTDCFRQADLFAFPTYYSKECFPLVLLEAMQHGLPCISTDEAGIPDIIDNGRTGLIVPKKDCATLADAIEKLINDKNLCRQMGQEGRMKYEDKFTLAVFERNICRILDEYSK